MVPPIDKQLYIIDTDKIEFDKLNPRGETEKMIIQDKSFRNLVDSIKQYGILEPIIIKEDIVTRGNYILVDGERRLRAAQKAELENVPSLIANDEADGHILAYQVHMLRKSWTKIAETKSIKRIIEGITKTTPDITETELKKKIKSITNHTTHSINDIFTLINFDDRLIELALLGDLKMSYLVRIDRDFVKPIESNYPEVLKTYSQNKIRNILARKALDNLLVDTRFMMDKFKIVFQDKKHREKIKSLLIDFLTNSSKNIKDTFDEYNAFIKSLDQTPLAPTKPTASSNPNNVPDEDKSSQRGDKTKTCSTNSSEKESPTTAPSDKNEHGSNQSSNTSLTYKSLTLTKQDQTKINDIKPKYESIGNTFSKEETEYIQEALHCLEVHCFKAAVLMIWATGISRILNYISRDITDYNTASSEMQISKKSFYKHHCDNFQTKAQNIDEIRHASKDIQLIAFICYKNIIVETDFNKLKSDFNIRNDCAHPTSITLNVNETVAIFEHIFNIILNNTKLK